MELISIEEYLQSKPCNIGMLFKALARIDSPIAYIYISTDESPCLKQSGYIILPNSLLDELAIRLLSKELDAEMGDVLLHILHSLIPDKRDGMNIFPSFEEINEKFKDSLLQIFLDYQIFCLFKDNFSKSLKKLYDPNHPLYWASEFCVMPYTTDHYGKLRITMSEKRLSLSNIYLDKSHKDLRFNVENSQDSYTKDSLETKLSLDELNAAKELIELVGVNRVKNLSSIFNPKWVHFSTELNACIDVHEAMFINKEGNPSIGNIMRAGNILHEKFPYINSGKNINPKKYNAATKRITTVANEDDK